MLVAEEERTRRTARVVEDMAGGEASLAAIERKVTNVTDAIADGHAARPLVEKLQAPETERAALKARKAEVAIHQRLLAQQIEALRSLTDMIVETADDPQAMGYADRREGLRRLGIEVTVAKHGSE